MNRDVDDPNPVDTDREPRFDKLFTFGLPIAWAAAALAFALWRTPYDDEWFSLTLATDTDWPHFWRSLSNDMHPPWVGLLDRTLMLSGWRWPVHVVRAVVSAFAITLSLSTLRRRSPIPVPFLILAAFHPIVFMYGAAARWYPFVFLAQALRFWAVFRPNVGKKARTAAFGVGAVLGPAAGYIDLIFVAIDSAAFVALRPKTETLRSRVTTIASAGLAIAAITLLSPLKNHLRQVVAQHLGTQIFARSAGMWALLGLVGEAHLPGWLVLTGAIALPALVAGSAILIASQWKNGMGIWIVSTELAWLLASTSGIWHPRYSLLLWLIVTAGTGLLLVRNRTGRVLAVAAALYLFSATALTVTQKFFIKNDLNEFDASTCSEPLMSRSYDLIVAPYRRTQEQILRHCRVSAPVIDLPWIRHFPSPAEQFAAFNVLLPRANDVLVVSIPSKGSSLETTNERVRALLSARCVLRDDRRVGADPHAALKRRLLSREAWWRYRMEWWRCTTDSSVPK